MTFILEDQIEGIFILPTCQKQQQQQRQNTLTESLPKTKYGMHMEKC